MAKRKQKAEKDVSSLIKAHLMEERVLTEASDAARELYNQGV